jgi:hypothetical protein
MQTFQKRKKITSIFLQASFAWPMHSIVPIAKVFTLPTLKYVQEFA